MGRWATYLIGPEREDPPAAYARHSKTVPGWVWWELPLAQGTPWDPGPGHTVVAHIFDSDVADIRGLTAGKVSWRWVYGEAALAAFEERPVDPLEPEERLPERAEEASRVIAEWAAGAQLTTDRQALTDILQRGHTFAEEGVSELLESLGIMSGDSPIEYQDLDPVVDAYGRPVDEAGPAEVEPPRPAGDTMAGVLAAAIDHTSPGWRGLVARNFLHSFGEPPSIVTLNGSAYIAFDPPISVGSVAGDSDREWASELYGVSGGWQEVPPEHAGSMLAAAAWARANVGTQGRPADEDRLLLNLEVPLDYPDGVEAPGRYPDTSKNEWWRHSIADPVHVGIELGMAEQLLDRADAVADWLDYGRTLLYTTLAEKFEQAGGTVHRGDGEVPGFGLTLGVSYRSVRGRYGSAGGDDPSWRRVVKRLRAGELTSVSLGAAVADGYGDVRDVQPWGDLSIGAQLAADERLYSLPAHLTVKISDPMRGLVRGPFVDDLVGRAVASLPVAGGWVDAARILYLGDGSSRYESFAGVPVGEQREPRSSVRGPAWRVLLGPGHLELLGGRAALEASGIFTDFRQIGSLLQVQCGAQPVDCTWERRAAMVGVLAPVLPPWPER